jgi:hypothetical protein
MNRTEARYKRLFLEPIRKCADYAPKMGQGSGNISLEGFQNLYGNDPLYSWIGFDSPLMYAAHKAAGGMTSLYRQLGIGCERLFRAIIQDMCSLNDDQSTWSYTVPTAGGQQRTLALDARIDIDDLRDKHLKQRVETWLQAYKEKLDVKTEIRGAVFEVRQGYKSKDSKRQNADLANAATAYTQRYLPVLTVMSTQLDWDLRTRYEIGKWGVLSGEPASTNPQVSTFAFCKKIVGYDLQDFFVRNAADFRNEVLTVLESLLEPS